MSVFKKVTVNDGAYNSTLSLNSGDLEITTDTYNNINLNSYLVEVKSTLAASSTGSGALYVNGGMVVNGRIYPTGSLHCSPTAITLTTTFITTFEYSRTPDYALGSTSYTQVGDYTYILSGRLYLTGGVAYIRYSATSNQPAAQIGTIRLRYAHLGDPQTNYGIFSLGSTGSFNNLIRIYIGNDDKLHFTTYDSSGNLCGNCNAAWSPGSGQEYEIEACYNLTSGLHNLFIDGTVHASHTQTGSRTTSCDYIQLGSEVVADAWISAGYFRDLMLFTNVQHTAAFSAGYNNCISNLGMNGNIYLINNDSEASLRLAANGDLTVDASGGDINFAATDVVHVLNTTANTSLTNGCLVLSGGLGAAGAISCGGGITFYNGTHTGALTIDSGGDISIDASGNDVNFAATDVIHVLNSAASTDTATGCLVLSGGLGVAGNLNVGGSIAGTNYLYVAGTATTSSAWTDNVNYWLTKSNHTVTLTWEDSATANPSANTLTLMTLGTAYRPPNIVYFVISILNNNAAAYGLMQVQTDGNVYVSPGPTVAAFTADVNAALYAGSITYNVV